MSIQTALCPRCGIRRSVHTNRPDSTELCRSCWSVEPLWPTIPSEPTRCGSPAGYQVHRRAHEVPCDECTFAHTYACRRRRYERRAT